MANISNVEGAAATIAAVDAAGKSIVDTAAQFKESYSQLSNSLGMLGKAAMSSEQSMGKYNSAVLGGSNALGDLIKIVGKGGPLAFAIGGLVKVFGVLTTSILSQNDAYLKAKDTLNQFGFSSEMTASEIAKMGRQAGYTKDELEKYTGAITSLGVDMLSLGTSFGKGAKVFMEMAAVGVDTVTQFGKMGISQEQLTKSQAHYVKLLSAQGIQITGNMASTEQLKKSSLEYTKNLLTLAALSGEDIESIKRKQEAARADANFQIGQAMKAKEAAALEEEYNKTGDASLKVRAEQLKTEITNAQKLQDAAIAFGLAGQDLSAFNQMIQTGTFTELSAKFAPFGEGLLQFIKDVLAGTEGVDASQLPIKLAQMTDRAMDAVGKAATFGPSEIQNAVLLTTEGIKRAAQLRGMSEEEYVKMVKKLIEDRQKAEQSDPLANLRANQIKIEKSMQIAYEELTETLRGPLTLALEAFQKAVMWAGRSLLKISSWIPGVDKEMTQKLIDSLTPVEELDKEMGELKDVLKSGRRDLYMPFATGEGTNVIQKSLEPEEKEQMQRRITQLEAARKESAAMQFQAPSAGGGPGSKRITHAELMAKFGGIIRPGGDVHKDGEYVDDRMIMLLSRLKDQDWMGLVTSVNDNFHQNRTSKHREGKAIDFTVKQGLYNAELAEKIKSFIEGEIPGLKVRDEYANPSSGATGGHFHVELGARRGMMPGTFDAPTSGTLMAVHNREMIAPLDPNSIIAKLLTASPSEAESIIGGMNNTDIAAALKEGFGQMNEKMDTFISQVQTLNYTQEELLMYSRT